MTSSKPVVLQHTKAEASFVLPNDLAARCRLKEGRRQEFQKDASLLIKRQSCKRSFFIVDSSW